MVTPELKAQMVKIARQRGYTLEQLSDKETMLGLMREALAALDKLCTEATEGRTKRGRDILGQIAAVAYLDIRGRDLCRSVGEVLA